MKRKATDVLADVFIYVFMAVLSLLCLIPFIHVLSVSISGNGAVMSNQVFLIPKDVNLDAYKTVFGDSTMMRSLWFTVFVTVAFTALGMFLTICGAFALSRKRLKGRKVIGVIFLILHCRNNSRLYTYEPVAPYKYGGGFDTPACIFGI